MEDILVPLAPFVMVVLIVYFATRSTARIREAQYQTIQTAIKEGRELTPEMMAGLEPKKKSQSSATGGLVLIAVAIALVGLGYLLPEAITELKQDPSVNFPLLMSAVALFPGLIGLVILVSALARGRKDHGQRT